MQNYTTKTLVAAAHCPDRARACELPTGGELFTDREAAALAQCISTRGKTRGRWKRTAPKYGTDGYVAFQARTMALNPHRMPSQCVILFDDDQTALFWSIVHKLEYVAHHEDSAYRARVADQLLRAAWLHVWC